MRVCIIHHSALLIRNIFCHYWEERRERRRVEEGRKEMEMSRAERGREVEEDCIGRRLYNGK